MKTLLMLMERLLGSVEKDGEPRADMYLPAEKMLASAIVGVIMTAFFGWRCYASGEFYWGILAVVMALVAICSLLCWKNQTIRMIDDEQFEYTTFLGNKKVYKFADIIALRRNKDSITMFVGNGKVHIESMAILSPRLFERINKAMEENIPETVKRV